MTGSRTSDCPASVDGPQNGPLILTEDEGLLDDLLRLCAAAGAVPRVAHGTAVRGRDWDGARLVVVGDDCAGRLYGVPRREGVVLVGKDADDAGVWQRAVGIGAANVALLPGHENWLVDRIADAAEGVGRPALTVGVVGGCGGAGASTLACALALGAARAGERTMLIDGDPLGGGLDVLLGGEKATGLRWPAFAGSRGRVAAQALEEALPSVHALRVLSWDRGDCAAVPPEAMRAVLAAARRRGGVVVVDLPRRLDDTAVEAIGQLDLGLVVVPAELRALAASHRVASVLNLLMRDVRAVVRGPFGTGMDGPEVARLLGVPLAGELPAEPHLADDVSAGRPPGAAERGPLARFSTAFWTHALAERQQGEPA
ncbi:septum site-determining protein Ssd [Streptomyces mashuensis]|uniref:septum site-determining protein Ssd n=1 Tax=Streptomyces mashuensis TaxID=33904 RepID=UPI001E39ECED|nr:septum site-determining protein Ssd [Streptomyces mashuensis]